MNRQFSPPASSPTYGSQRLGRLATVSPSGTPQNSPVGYTVNAELGTIDIFGFNLAKSKKYRNVRANPKVAFVVDDLASSGPLGRAGSRDARHRRGASRGGAADAADGPPSDPCPPQAHHQLGRRHRLAGHVRPRRDRWHERGGMTAPAPAARQPPALTSTRLSNGWRRLASSCPTGSSTTAPWRARRSTRSASRASWGSGHKRFARIAGPAVTAEAGAVARLAIIARRLQGTARVDRPFRNRDRRRWVGRPVELWVPRLVPGDGNGAVSRGDPRRATRCGPSRRPTHRRAGRNWHGRSVIGLRVTARARSHPRWPAAIEVVADVARWTTCKRAVVAAAAEAARYYVASPNIYFLHGVTGAMAIELLAPHLSGAGPGGSTGPARGRARAMYAGARPVAEVRVAGAPRDSWPRRPRPATTRTRSSSSRRRCGLST